MPASTATQFGKLLHLTHREQEIAALVAQGLTNREIAQRLGLSVFTVKSYVSNILRKLELKNRSQIALEEITQTFTQDTQALPTPRGEAAQEPSSESFTDADEYASMRVLDSKKGADSAPIWMKSEGDPSSQGEEGRQPSNLPEQSQQAPKKGDIYQRRTRYDDAYLQEYAEPLSQRFNAALRN